MAAAPVAADQDLAAAAAAGGIDFRIGELDVLAAHHDRAAGRAAVLARRRDRAGELDGLRRSARRLAAAGGGVEHDHAVVAADRVGPDHALGVDDGIDHRARRRGGELDPPAVGAERAALGVADQRLERPAGGDVDDFVGDAVADRERDQLVAVHVEREAVAGCQRHRAERRGDGAGVAHAGRDQRGKAAARRRDRSLD